MLPRSWKKQTFERRFWDKVDWSTDETVCWPWTATIQPNGYGYFGCDGRTGYVHRLAYELEFGPIPEGLVIDHLCSEKSCCNPFHLEPVTQHENVLRSMFSPATAGLFSVSG